MSKSSSKKRATTRAIRSPSASEIARNVGHFDTWSTFQGCEQVSYSDLPENIKRDAARVFRLERRIPKQWIDETSKEYHSFSQHTTKGVMRFLEETWNTSPSLFSDSVASSKNAETLSEVIIVYSAWQRLQQMRKSKEKWSEADFVANVYNIFRSSAVRESSHRVHCTISLPQPVPRLEAGSQALRILGTKTAIPDCAVFIPAASIRSLSHSAKSPFKVLKAHPSVTKTGTSSARSSFRFQSTPCAQLPDTPAFEFASSFWEDKKPVHQLLEDAYRQNRMSTTSAVRHLHSLHIQAPVFGLVWSNGTVRAHVDWCVNEGEIPSSYSAPYPGNSGDDHGDIFHEWQLDKPSDILQVFYLIKNIDHWTTGRFKEHVIEGVNDLLKDIVSGGKNYEPWKRTGDLPCAVLADMNKEKKENIDISLSTITTSAASTPPKPKSRRRK